MRTKFLLSAAAAFLVVGCGGGEKAEDGNPVAKGQSQDGQDEIGDDGNQADTEYVPDESGDGQATEVEGKANADGEGDGNSEEAVAEE